jgi:hypothetical protein
MSRATWEGAGGVEDFEIASKLASIPRSVAMELTTTQRPASSKLVTPDQTNQRVAPLFGEAVVAEGDS